MMVYLKPVLLIIQFLFTKINLQSQTDVCVPGSEFGNVTDRITVLVNVPENTGMNGKARNIWDPQLFDQEIFIGFGNTSTNPGPIDLVSYNQQTSLIQYHGMNRNVAIEKFRVYDSELYIPASDPVTGNILKYSIRKKDEFEELAFTPGLAHVRDIAVFENHRFLHGNSRCPSQKSADCNGLILENISTGVVETGILSPLLELADPLKNSRWNWFFGYLIWNGGLILPNDTEDLTLPSVPDDFVYKAKNHINIETFVAPFSDVFISSAESLICYQDLRFQFDLNYI